jgi:hypothetical protein
MSHLLAEYSSTSDVSESSVGDATALAVSKPSPPTLSPGVAAFKASRRAAALERLAALEAAAADAPEGPFWCQLLPPVPISPPIGKRARSSITVPTSRLYPSALQDLEESESSLSEPPLKRSNVPLPAPAPIVYAEANGPPIDVQPSSAGGAYANRISAVASRAVQEAPEVARRSERARAAARRAAGTYGF